MDQNMQFLFFVQSYLLLKNIYAIHTTFNRRNTNFCRPIVALVLAFTAMHLAQMMTLRSQNKTNDMHQNNSDRLIPYLRQSI